MFAKSANAWMLAALVLLFAAGCDRTSKPPAESAKPAPGSMISPDAMQAAGKDGVRDSFFDLTLLPEEPRAGDELRAVVAGVGGPFMFAWEKNGVPITGQNKTRLSGHGLVRGDVIRVVVTAGDKEASAERVISNSPPEDVSVTLKTPYLCRGVDLEVEARARDADGDPVEFRYAWYVNGVALYGKGSSVLAGESYSRGDIVKLTVTPLDQQEEGEPFSEGLQFEVGNAPPRIVTSPPTSITSLDYRYQARAMDADEDEITYQLSKGPEGMTIDPASGLVLWSMPVDASGTFEVRIVARDAEGEGPWQEFSLEINRSPSATEGEEKPD
jgi:hypothetical protein